MKNRQKNTLTMEDIMCLLNIIVCMELCAEDIYEHVELELSKQKKKPTGYYEKVNN